MGANSARRQVASGHNEPAPSQVNGMLAYTQRHLNPCSVTLSSYSMSGSVKHQAPPGLGIR